MKMKYEKPQLLSYGSIAEITHGDFSDKTGDDETGGGPCYDCDASGP
jgi:hypothetical protein